MILYPMKADQHSPKAISSISQGITDSVALHRFGLPGLLHLGCSFQISRQMPHAGQLFINDPLRFGLKGRSLFWGKAQINKYVATNRGDVRGLGLDHHFSLLTRITTSNTGSSRSICYFKSCTGQ